MDYFDKKKEEVKEEVKKVEPPKIEKPKSIFWRREQKEVKK